MTAYSPTLIQTCQYKVKGLSEFYGPQSHPPPLEMVQVIYLCIIVIQERQLHQINKTVFLVFFCIFRHDFLFDDIFIRLLN
jgi:hypothetical protein